MCSLRAALLLLFVSMVTARTVNPAVKCKSSDAPYYESIGGVCKSCTNIWGVKSYTKEWINKTLNQWRPCIVKDCRDGYGDIITATGTCKICTVANATKYAANTCLPTGCDVGYKASGNKCVAIMCTAPNTPGYAMELKKVLEAPFLKVTFVDDKCAAGYHGTPTATACTSDGPFTLKGCTAFAGKCVNGELIEQSQRTEDNHCGKCFPNFKLVGTKCTQCDSKPNALLLSDACEKILLCAGGFKPSADDLKCVACTGHTGVTKYGSHTARNMAVEWKKGDLTKKVGSSDDFCEAAFCSKGFCKVDKGGSLCHVTDKAQQECKACDKTGVLTFEDNPITGPKTTVRNWREIVVEPRSLECQPATCAKGFFLEEFHGATLPTMFCKHDSRLNRGVCPKQKRCTSCDKFQGPEKKMYSTKYSLCTAKDGFIIKTCMKGYTPSANKTSCTKIECVCANGYPSHSCTEPNQEKCQGCKAGFKYEQASGKCTACGVSNVKEYCKREENIMRDTCYAKSCEDGSEKTIIDPKGVCAKSCTPTTTTPKHSFPDYYLNSLNSVSATDIAVHAALFALITVAMTGRD